jgi:hypothetical protein
VDIAKALFEILTEVEQSLFRRNTRLDFFGRIEDLQKFMREYDLEYDDLEVEE